MLTSYVSLPLKTAIRDGNNNRLSIGEFSFMKKGLSSYTEANNARDVIAMLNPLSFLHLEDYHVTKVHSTVTDTAILRIKMSSHPPVNEQPININSFGRVNKKLCHFIIDYFSLQVVFNNWYPFSTQVAPAPYAKMTPEDVMTAIKRSQMIFVSLCLCLTFNNNIYSYFSENGTLGWDVPTLKQLCSACVGYIKKMKMESFHRGRDTLQTRTACGFITGYSFNLFALVLLFPVKPT